MEILDRCLLEKQTFLKMLKLLFSSISCRRDKFLYINCSEQPNTILVTNGDYELLNSYIPVTFSIHAIQLPEEKYQELIKFLSLTDVTLPYVFRLDIINKALNKFKIDEVYTSRNEKGVIFMISPDGTISEKMTEEEDEEDVEEELDELEYIVFDREDICGVIADNQMAVDTLSEVVEELFRHTSEDYFESNNLPAYRTHFDVTDVDHLARIRVDRSILNLPEYRADIDTYMTNIDGLDMPSIKEFCKKLKITTIPVIVFREYDYLRSISYIKSKDMTIVSGRPYRLITILKEKHNYVRE